MSEGVPVWRAPRFAAAIIALGDGPLNGALFIIRSVHDSHLKARPIVVSLQPRLPYLLTKCAFSLERLEIQLHQPLQVPTRQIGGLSMS
jgi:hypothetical protein